MDLDNTIQRCADSSILCFCTGNRTKQLEVRNGLASVNRSLMDLRRGDYFVPTGKRAEPSPLSKDPQLARDLWELSEKIVKEKTEK